MKQIVVLNDVDNVATSLVPLEAQSRIEVELNGERRTITVLDTIPFGHKLAIRSMALGDEVRPANASGIAWSKSPAAP